MPTHRTRVRITCGRSLTALSLLAANLPATAESIDFVAEHLPEVAIDNRYASLPLWSRFDTASPNAWGFGIQGGYAQTQAGSLRLAGPMLSLAATHSIGDAWQLSAFAFIDDFNLSSGIERRALDVTFATNVPLDLPAQAQFSGLSGSARHIGAGIAVRHKTELRLWGGYEWSAGLLWQRLVLRDYALNFRLLDGASAGANGRIDYSATYTHVAPFVALAWPREYGVWQSTPHLQVALPLPRRGVVGRISGSTFDVQGDTATNGQGKHFGDASVTVGWDLTYRPWGLTVDLGSVISQALLERVIHKGVSQNWLLSLRWDY